MHTAPGVVCRTDPEREIASRALHVLRGIVANNSQYAAGQLPAGVIEAYTFHRGLTAAARRADFGFSPGTWCAAPPVLLLRALSLATTADNDQAGRAITTQRTLAPAIHGLPAAGPSPAARPRACRCARKQRNE